MYNHVVGNTDNGVFIIQGILLPFGKPTFASPYQNVLHLESKTPFKLSSD